MNLMELYCYNNKATCLKFLSTLYKLEVKSIVEIGVWQGNHAFFLHNLFPEADLYLVDPWKPTEYYLENGHSPGTSDQDFQEAYESTLKFFKDSPNTTILRDTSLNAAPKVPDNIDLVFIDASHDYKSVKEDILTWKDKVRPGGLLSGHDYDPKFPGVIQAVDECLGSNFSMTADSVWYTFKEPPSL